VTRAISVCVRCDRQVPRRGVSWPEGFICNRCYQQATRRRDLCPGCTHPRLLPGLLDGAPACSDCAGLGRNFRCTRCGEEDEPYRKGLCARCCLRDDLIAMLAGPDGQIPRQVRPVIEALIGQEQPRSAMIWLRNSEVVRLLRGLADGTLPLTHETFDDAPSRRTATHLRELFVHHQVLPPRDRTLLLFEAWLDRFLADHSPATVALLSGFARWHHLRQMRSLAESGQLKPGRAATARQEITVAAQLLTHLDGLGQSTDEFTQAHLEAWLSAGPTTRYVARTFVVWAVRNRRLPRVTFPYRQAKSRPVMSEEERLATVRRCLRDPHWASARTRFAAVLLLLYAQPVTKIAKLRLEDLARQDDLVTVNLGSAPAVLPDAVRPLLEEHLAHRPNTFTAANPDSPWLFPGTRPGQPLTANSMMIDLREAGIQLLGARNGALRTLTLDMPAAVAADVLGYSATVTEQHARLAGSPWMSYPNHLRRDTADHA
jgi:integrase